jgi:hypothetical protein
MISRSDWINLESTKIKISMSGSRSRKNSSNSNSTRITLGQQPEKTKHMMMKLEKYDDEIREQEARENTLIC